MVERFVAVLESAAPDDAAVLTRHGEAILEALEGGSAVEPLIEQAYRAALFLSDPRRSSSEPPGRGESWDGIVKLGSPADVHSLIDRR